MNVVPLLSQNLKYCFGAFVVVLGGRIICVADILYRFLCHKSQLCDSAMHLSRFLHDWELCSQWEKPAFHKFWQHDLEELQYATIRAMSKCVKVNAICNIPNEVEREKDVKCGEVDDGFVSCGNVKIFHVVL